MEDARTVVVRLSVNALKKERKKKPLESFVREVCTNVSSGRGRFGGVENYVVEYEKSYEKKKEKKREKNKK